MDDFNPNQVLLFDIVDQAAAAFEANGLDPAQHIDQIVDYVAAGVRRELEKVARIRFQIQHQVDGAIPEDLSTN